MATRGCPRRGDTSIKGRDRTVIKAWVVVRMARASDLGIIRHMTTTPTPDPLAALAAELGRIGRRLDGMGVELLALRGGMPVRAGRPESRARRPDGAR